MATLALQPSKPITFWNWLVKTHPSITDVEQRRQSRLLAMMSIALVVGGILGVFSTAYNVLKLGYPSTQVPVILPVPLVSLLAFYVNRRGKYNIAAGLLILMLVGVIFTGWLISGVASLMFYF